MSPVTATRTDWSPVDLGHIARAVELLATRVDGRERTVGSTTVLAQWLYGNWYAAPTADRQEGPACASGVLTAAHAGTDCWEGAEVIRVGLAGAVVVRTADDRIRAVPRGDYASAFGSSRVGLLPRVGDTLRIRQRNGCVSADGWWQTWHGPRRASLEGSISRIYLAPDPDRVPPAVTAATRALHHHSRQRPLSWTLKVGVHPAATTRPDAMVVYVPDSHVETVAALLAENVGALLLDASPPLTRVVAPGVAWAEDPGDGRSFGESRCELLASVIRTLLDQPGPAAHEGAAGLDITAPAVAAGLHGAGLDPAAPHRRLGSVAAPHHTAVPEVVR